MSVGNQEATFLISSAGGYISAFMNRVRKHLPYVYRYPGVMPRAVANYLQMATGKRRLRGVEFALTYDCVAHCEHCSAEFLREKTPNREALSLTQIKNVASQCLDLGALNINLTGGEALLRQDLPEIVAACRPRSTVVSLASNGWLIDNSVAKNIASWGVSIVTMSMDSADPKTHDERRRLPGCYDQLMKAVDYLQRAGVEVFLNTILTRENMANGDMEEMVRLAKQKDVVLTVNLACEVGGWQTADVHPKSGGTDYHRSLMKHPHVRWEGSSNYFREGCPAGLEKIYISPYGDVMPCNFIHLSFGNLQNLPLAMIWEKILSDPTFNRIHKRCLVAENAEFRREYLTPISKSPVHPMPVGEVPLDCKDRV